MNPFVGSMLIAATVLQLIAICQLGWLVHNVRSTHGSFYFGEVVRDYGRRLFLVERTTPQMTEFGRDLRAKRLAPTRLALVVVCVSLSLWAVVIVAIIQLR